jgi:hypothetical protein
MTQLGKPLVFYLKYLAEMNRLYGDPEEGEEPDLTGLDDAEQVQEMARTVGAAAHEQAADFLELCGKGIEDHFTGLGTAAILANKRRRSKVADTLWWEAKVRVSSVPSGEFSCGVWVTAPPNVRISVEKDVCGVVVPYLWSKGGRKGNDAVRKILGSWANPRVGEGLFDSRAPIALARIPIKAQPPESFDVDRDQLIAEVMKVIARIGAEETKKIANFVAGLKAPNEGGTESQLAPSPQPL